MGVRGVEELVAVLPPSAVASATAVLDGLAGLQSVRHAALGPDGIGELLPLWDRLAANLSCWVDAVLCLDG